MKRGKPLKRTPLKRTTPLKAKSTPKAKKKLEAKSPLRKRSHKQEALYEKRRPFVAEFLAKRPWCEACPVFAGHDGKVAYKRRESCDVHELVRRSQGGSILDEDNCMAVCRPCHRRIGENPELAFTLGLARKGHGQDRK